MIEGGVVVRERETEEDACEAGNDLKISPPSSESSPAPPFRESFPLSPDRLSFPEPPWCAAAAGVYLMVG
jgi:hypothetical protein